MNPGLRSFLAQVQESEEAGLFTESGYVEVGRPVKPFLEVPILQQKLAERGCFPVIYCPQVEGSKLPLVFSLFSSMELHGLALGLDPDKWNQRDVSLESKIKSGRPQAHENGPAF